MFDILVLSHLLYEKPHYLIVTIGRIGGFLVTDTSNVGVLGISPLYLEEDASRKLETSRSALHNHD